MKPLIIQSLTMNNLGSYLDKDPHPLTPVQNLQEYADSKQRDSGIGALELCQGKALEAAGSDEDEGTPPNTTMRFYRMMSEKEAIETFS